MTLPPDQDSQPAVASNAAIAGPDPSRLPFDEALAELQRTVSELEGGGLSLERSIALYERGVALHERCAALLGEAELRVRQLVTRAGGALEAVELRGEDPEDAADR